MSATSVVYGTRLASLDAVNTTLNYAGTWDAGAIYISGSKTINRYPICEFDLLAPASGPPLVYGQAVASAELWGNVIGIYGTAYKLAVDRLSDSHATLYDYHAATWGAFDGVGAWDVAGGATAAPGHTWAQPTATGEQSLNNVGKDGIDFTALVNDALTNRGGRLIVRFRVEPINPAVSHEIGVIGFSDTFHGEGGSLGPYAVRLIIISDADAQTGRRQPSAIGQAVSWA